MSTSEPILRDAAAAIRRGNFAAAYDTAQSGLEQAPRDPALLGIAAFAALRTGKQTEALGLLRRQIEVVPTDRAARLNLATLLASMGSPAEALALATNHGGHPKLARLAGYLHQQAGDFGNAISAYETALAQVPEDWESWNNLGNCKAAVGDRAGAIQAFENAINRAPDGGSPELFLNLAQVLSASEDRDKRLHTAQQAAMRFPRDHAVQVELGLALAAVGKLDLAEETLRAAATMETTFGEARLELGLLYENANRLDELDAHVAECEAIDPRPELNFLKAWSLRRRDRFEEAKVLADLIPPTINPIRTAQLRAEIAERLGETAEAFRQYSLMNQASREAHPAPPGPTFREQTVAATAAMTAPLAPVPRAPDAQSDPVFIVGSPRSGTTLLDTLLTALPEVQVFEEQPMLAQVETAFPGLERESDPARIAAARARYFELAQAIQGPASGRRVIDKMPLHLTHMPVIHRLFPEAQVVLVERHPLDAVLSCFMANFTPNHAMRSYTDLEEAARTYDAVFANWRRARELLPLNVHSVRYERMIADLEAEMRPLLEFLGLPWRAEVLDNQTSAKRRGAVRTASYAQIGQPLYARAVGRWERYQAELEPIRPLVQPWIDWLGY